MDVRCLLLATLLLPSVASGRSLPQSWRIPVQERTLANGLRVVVSRNDSAPVFGLCVSYGAGFRLEPEGSSGYAHLFEHMMFEGTPDAAKGVFDRVVENGGGTDNADTRFDVTEYFETAPVSALEPILWLEADRMKGLYLSQKNLDNQRQVVEEEVRANFINEPYGQFYWLDLPQKAFDKFPNSHNFLGDFSDLDRATLQNVRAFFQEYYAPNNAVISVTGDVNPQEIFAKVQRYFGAIPRRGLPARPDVFEAPQRAERRTTEYDKLAREPAIAVGYRMPPHNAPGAMAGAVAGQILLGGHASRLYQALVKDKKLAVSVYGGVNWPLGNPYEYGGPTLMTSFIVYPSSVSEKRLLAAYDGVIRRLAETGCSTAELDRVLTKMRSDWYGEMESPEHRAALLGEVTLFDGDPERINVIAAEISTVTPREIQEFARKYLVPSNRTVINRVPFAAKAPKARRKREMQP
ncbi:MAG: M16 family metallopeptidase [Terriglobia bacterium]